MHLFFMLMLWLLVLHNVCRVFFIFYFLVTACTITFLLPSVCAHAGIFTVEKNKTRNVISHKRMCNQPETSLEWQDILHVPCTQMFTWALWSEVHILARAIARRLAQLYVHNRFELICPSWYQYDQCCFLSGMFLLFWTGTCLTSVELQQVFASSTCSCALRWCFMWGMNGWSFSIQPWNLGCITFLSSKTCLMSGKYLSSVPSVFLCCYVHVSFTHKFSSASMTSLKVIGLD